MEEGGESDSVRVAHSPEIKERSMILGNLMPAPLCQFAKVTISCIDLHTYIKYYYVSDEQTYTLVPHTVAKLANGYNLFHLGY